MSDLKQRIVRWIAVCVLIFPSIAFASDPLEIKAPSVDRDGTFTVTVTNHHAYNFITVYRKTEGGSWQLLDSYSGQTKQTKRFRQSSLRGGVWRYSVRAVQLDYSQLPPTPRQGPSKETSVLVAALPNIGNTSVSVKEDVSENASLYNFSDRTTGKDSTTTGHPISYQIISGESGLFTINSRTGVIALASQPLDFETAQRHQLRVRASSRGGNREATLVVNVKNVNDVAPSIGSERLDLREDTPQGAVVFDINGDDDADPEGDALQYSLLGGGGGVFDIDEATGRIELINSDRLGYQLGGIYDLLVEVTDGKFNSRANISISVTNPAPPADASNVSVDIEEKAVGGNVYHVSWSPSRASAYQLILRSKGGESRTLPVSAYSATVTAPALGSFSISLVACNTEDTCTDGVLAGRYVERERIRFSHFDTLSSPMLETDLAGSVLERFHYEPYGASEGAAREDVTYTGHVADPDLGLIYMGARYYDPEIGRFYSNDPVGYLGHLNRGNPVHGFGRYTYANNNPYKYVDPDGEFGIAGAIYGAIAGGVGGYIASGGDLTSTLAGAAAGGAVGAVNPFASSAVGMAAGGSVASVSGQAIGSVTNAAMDKGILNVSVSDIEVDPITTVAGAVGAGVGGVVGKGVASLTARSVVGNTLEAAGTPTAAGLTAGAVIEGAIVGGAESVAPRADEVSSQAAGAVNQMVEKFKDLNR